MHSDRLGDLVKITIGRTPSRANADFWDTKKTGQNIWLSIADLLNPKGSVIGDGKEYISDLAASNFAIVPKGTLLVSFKLTLGRLAFAGRDLRTNEAIAALRNDEAKILNGYLYYFLSYFDWMDYAAADKKVKGFTLNKGKLNNIRVHYPQSLEEQRRIVAKLDAAFEKIDRAARSTRQILNDTTPLLSSNRKRTFKSVSGLNYVTLGEICTMKNGRSFKRTEWSKLGLPIIRIQNLNNPRAEFNYFNGKYDSSVEISSGDLLFSWSGTVGTSFGPHIWGGNKAVLNQHIFRITFDKSKLDKQYLYHYLKEMTSEIEKQTHGAGGLVHVTKSKLARTPVPLPSLKEQALISSHLTNYQTLINNLRGQLSTKIADLSSLKRSMLNQAFSRSDVE